jgi:hypothetical protein
MDREITMTKQMTKFDERGRVAALSKPVPLTEWEMARIAAGYFWNGTSITQGAFAIMEKGRADGEEANDR